MIRFLIATAAVWTLIVALLWVTADWDTDDRPEWHKRPHE